MPLHDAKYYPERFIELKKSVIGDEAKVTRAWADLLGALKDATAEYERKGPSMIPIVEFDQLETLGTFTFPQARNERFCATFRSNRSTTSHSDLIDTSIVHSDESTDSETTNLLRRRGCVLIRNVVPDEEALSWKQQLRQYVTENPDVVGTSFESPLTRKDK